MSDVIWAAIIAAFSSISVALINGLMAYRSQGGSGLKIRPIVSRAFILFVGFIAGIFVYKTLISDDMEKIDQEMLAGNKVAEFDAKDFRDWNQIVAWGTDFTNPVIGPANVQSQSGEENGIPYYEYELAIDDDVWRDYTITYKKPIQAELIMVRFYLPDDPENKIAENQVGLVVLEPNQSPSSPRVAESIVTASEGKWTLVVLDLRNRSNLTGQPLASNPCELQISVSLKGGSEISADTQVKIRVADISLYEKVGESSFAYASDGLSSFTPITLLSEDVAEFPWETTRISEPPNNQSESVQAQVGGIVGAFIKYPVRLSSIRRDTWLEGIQQGEVDRKLRDREHEFDFLIANFYIESDENTYVNIVPFIILEDDIWQQGFWQPVPTNEWTTIVWARMVDSTRYGTPYEQELLALRSKPDEPQVGFIRLIQILKQDQRIERLGFQFRLESDLPQDEQDEFDGIVYLGNVTFFSY